jgi:type I restriction enzyme M protein
MATKEYEDFFSSAPAELREGESLKKALAGEKVYVTNPELAKFIVKIAGLKKGETVYDPCCGSGSLLAAAGRTGKPARLFGRDISGKAVEFAREYLAASGFPKAEIAEGDAREAPLDKKGKPQKFDAVISEIPVGHYKDQFLSAMLDSAADGGRVVAAANAALLSSKSEKLFREGALADNLVDAVIALPRNLIYGSRAAACLLVLKKARKERDILFMNCADMKDADAAVSLYFERKSKKAVSHKAAPDEIDDAWCDLSPGRFLNADAAETNSFSINDIPAINAKIIKREKDIAALDGEIAERIGKLAP